MTNLTEHAEASATMTRENALAITVRSNNYLRDKLREQPDLDCICGGCILCAYRFLERATESLPADVDALKDNVQSILMQAGWDEDMRRTEAAAKDIVGLLRRTRAHQAPAPGVVEALATLAEQYEGMSRAWHRVAKHGGEWEQCDALCEGHRAALRQAQEQDAERPS